MDWVKIIHILCVMGWMTSVFAVPRALIFWRREWQELGKFGPLGDLTIRLYRFSAGLGIIALFSGLWLTWGVWGFQPWVYLKLALVALLTAHYIWTGILVFRARNGRFGQSDFYLRVFNEVSVIVVVATLWTVVVKPF